jgi:chromosome partitioning protein
MKTICIGNQKGGVGKTCITANLAIELTRLGKKVLLIDLDPQTDLTRQILDNYTEHTPSIMEVLQNTLPLHKIIQEILPSLFLLPGSPNTFLPVSRHNKSADMHLKRQLNNKKISKNFDIVLIDMPPGINETSIIGYNAADYVLAVVTPEAFSLENITNYLAMLTKIKEEWNHSLSIAGICINRVDRRRNLTKYMLKNLKKHFRDIVFDSCISNDTAIPTSHFRHTFVRNLNWRSRVVSQFTTLAKELLTKIS